MKTAFESALLVARAAGAKLTMGSVGTALALMLTLGGCTQSHTTGVDADGDGYERGVDCNDMDPTIYPGADEYVEDCCETIPVDKDCDGVPPICTCNPFLDADGDGYTSDVDCDDTDPATYPGAFEDCCEGIDRNCDGAADICTNCFPWVDEDGDGYPAESWGGPIDCDDSNAEIHPDAEEICFDEVDSNCDGNIDPVEGCIVVNPLPDADGDGYTADVDCDDTRSWVHPGAIEDCWDGVDNDCDGTIDEEPEGGCWILNGMLDVEELEDDPWTPGPTSEHEAKA